MFTSLSVHFLALIHFALFYLPRHWIRWGWVWYLQILVTEWLFLSLMLGLFYVYINPFAIWFIISICIFLYKRRFQIFDSKTNNSIHLKHELAPKKLLLNCIPWTNRPKYNEIEFHKLKHLTSSAKIKKDKVCIHIHGGAWMHGDANQLIEISKLFNEFNYEFISVNYVKYPNHHLDDIVQKIIKTVQEIVDEYSPKTEFIFYGRSAGGHLALMLASYFSKLNLKIVVLYPVIDLEDIFRNKNDHDILQSRTWIKNVIGNHFPDEELIERARTLSPIHQEYGKCSVLLLHGKNDPLVDIEQSDMFFDKYKNKMQIKYLRFQYATHGFDALWNGLSMVEAKKHLIEFIKS